MTTKERKATAHEWEAFGHTVVAKILRGSGDGPKRKLWQTLTVIGLLLCFSYGYAQMLPRTSTDPQMQDNLYDLELRQSFKLVDYGTASVTCATVRVKLKRHNTYGDTANYFVFANPLFDPSDSLLRTVLPQKISGDSIALWGYINDTLAINDTFYAQWYVFLNE